MEVQLARMEPVSSLGAGVAQTRYSARSFPLLSTSALSFPQESQATWQRYAIPLALGYQYRKGQWLLTSSLNIAPHWQSKRPSSRTNSKGNEHWMNIWRIEPQMMVRYEPNAKHELSAKVAFIDSIDPLENYYEALILQKSSFVISWA